MRNSRFEMQGKQSSLQVRCKLELLMRVDMRVFIYCLPRKGLERLMLGVGKRIYCSHYKEVKNAVFENKWFNNIHQ